jgi:hypothetical protein
MNLAEDRFHVIGLKALGRLRDQLEMMIQLHNGQSNAPVGQSGGRAGVQHEPFPGGHDAGLRNLAA